MRMDLQSDLCELVIDGVPTLVDANYSMRWVERLDGSAYPVLYFRGKRIVKSWQIRLMHNMPEDPDGGNANTN